MPPRSGMYAISGAATAGRGRNRGAARSWPWASALLGEARQLETTRAGSRCFLYFACVALLGACEASDCEAFGSFGTALNALREETLATAFSATRQVNDGTRRHAAELCL